MNRYDFVFAKNSDVAVFSSYCGQRNADAFLGKIEVKILISLRHCKSQSPEYVVRPQFESESIFNHEQS